MTSLLTPVYWWKWPSPVFCSQRVLEMKSSRKRCSTSKCERHENVDYEYGFNAMGLMKLIFRLPRIYHAFETPAFQRGFQMRALLVKWAPGHRRKYFQRNVSKQLCMTTWWTLVNIHRILIFVCQAMFCQEYLPNELLRIAIHQGLALLTLSWDKNWDSHSLVNGYPSFYPRIALVAPSPEMTKRICIKFNEIRHGELENNSWYWINLKLNVSLVWYI